MNSALIIPMYSMVLLTFLVALYGFRERLNSVRSGQVKARYYQWFQGAEPPLSVIQSSRHYTNLFELPVLYYAATILAIFTPVNGPWIQIWAWLFVAARVAHAYIHLSHNRLRPRLVSFVVGWLAVLCMWTQLLLNVVS